MNNGEKNATFQYTYSAGEQEELRRIRSKYLPREENKMELLRRLDAQVTAKATIRSIATGVTGTLLLGIGMSCCMVWADSVLALAYPLYNRTLKKERERVAPQILRLTEELMK